jgi:hypothetical protein
MTRRLRSPALVALALLLGQGAAFALPLSSTYTPRYVPSFAKQSQTFTNTVRPCVSHEVLDNTRHAFYDSCTGAFIRADVR